MTATVQRHIDLKPDSRLAFQHPYPATLYTKEHQGQKSTRVLKGKRDRARDVEMSRPSGVCLEENGKLGFHVDCRNLNAMTI